MKEIKNVLTQILFLIAVMGLVIIPLLILFPFGDSNVYDKVEIRGDVKVAVFLQLLFAISVGLLMSLLCPQRYLGKKV